MGDLKLWWVGWTVPDEVPDKHMVRKWPAGIRGWHTGYGEGYTTWVAAVWAADAGKARDTALGCFGESAGLLGEWVDTNECDPTKPLSDRFPGGYPARPEAPGEGE